MTTKVTVVVEEDGSWDAMVTPVYGEGVPDGPSVRVKQGESHEMWISSGTGFRVDEVDVEDEAEDEAANDGDDAMGGVPDDDQDVASG